MSLPDPRLGLFYALSFGALGLTLPYLAPWLASRGTEAATVGVVAAAPSFATLATAFALGTFADRAADRRDAIVVLAWGACAAYALLLAVDSAPGIGVAWALGGLLTMGAMPIVDGAALDHARRRGTAWGPVRACGSVGFIVGLTAGGQLFERIGPEAFVPAVVGVAAARALAAHALPRFGHEGRTDGIAPAPGPWRGRASGWLAGIRRGVRPATAPRVGAPSPTAALLHPGFLAVIAGAALVNASHAFLYTFGLLHWTRTGIPESLASLAWTASIVAEVVLLWRFADVARRVPARACLLFAAAVAALRWSFTSLDPAFPVLLGLQALHAITFGLAYAATASFIARRVDESVAARAQALAATLSTAAMATMTLVSGALYEGFGAGGYRAMAGLAALGALLVATSYRTDLEDRVGAT